MMVDKHNRKVIHFRWVEESLKANHFLDDVNCLHLCPLPKKVPIEAFKDVHVKFTLVNNPKEKIIFDYLTDLYGFTRTDNFAK